MSFFLDTTVCGFSLYHILAFFLIYSCLGWCVEVVYAAATTDACLELLDAAGLRAPVLESLLDAIQLHLDRRAGEAFRVGAVLFSNQHGPLGATQTAKELLEQWNNA